MMGANEEPDLTPERINSALLRPMKYQICCEFWTYGILYAIIILIAEVCRAKAKDCGIPVILWVEIFFGLCLLKLIFVSCSYFGISSGNFKCVMYWYIAWTAIFLLLIFAWVIYGYVIYFSDDNVCQNTPDNFGWLVLMVIILFFVVLAAFILLIMVCILSCIVCALG